MTLPPSILCTLALMLLAVPPARAFELQRSPDGGAVVRWDRDTITYRISGRLSDELGRDDVRAAVDAAAGAWALGKGEPTIAISDWPASAFADREAGVQGIYWVDGADYVWDDREIGTTKVEYWGDGEMIRADILINGDRELCFGCATGFDLQSVLTHEMGHALGLEHSETKGATMWPTTRRGETWQRDLTPDDEAGIAEAYGQPFDRDDWARMGCQAAAPHAHGERSPWLFALVVALMAIAWHRSRRT